MSKKRFIALFVLGAFLVYAALCSVTLVYYAGRSAMNRRNTVSAWMNTAGESFRRADAPEAALNDFVLLSGDALQTNLPYIAAVYSPDGAVLAQTRDSLWAAFGGNTPAGEEIWVDMEPYFTPAQLEEIRRYARWSFGAGTHVERAVLERVGNAYAPVLLTLKNGYGDAGEKTLRFSDRSDAAAGLFEADGRLFLFSTAKTRGLTKALAGAKDLIPQFGEQIRVKYGPDPYDGEIVLSAPQKGLTVNVFTCAQNGQTLYLAVIYAENAALSTLALADWTLGIFTVLYLFLFAAALILAFRRYRARERLANSRYSFLSAAAHELKTPLSVIMGAGECLAENVAPEKTAEYAGVILHESARMKDLIEDMLRQNRFLSAGEITKTPTLLSALVKRQAQAYESAAAQKRISLTVQAEEGLWILCDADMLSIALGNFLSNAVKYAPAGAAIEVEARREGKKAAVSVYNTGSRISPAALPHIWEELYREDAVRGDGAGSGLGLSIARRVFELHRFAYGCVSDDAGTRFTFACPLARAAKEAPSGGGRIKTPRLRPAEKCAAAACVLSPAGVASLLVMMKAELGLFAVPGVVCSLAGALSGLLMLLFCLLSRRDGAKPGRRWLLIAGAAAMLLPPAFAVFLYNAFLHA